MMIPEYPALFSLLGAPRGKGRSEHASGGDNRAPQRGRDGHWDMGTSVGAGAKGQGRGGGRGRGRGWEGRVGREGRGRRRGRGRGREVGEGRGGGEQGGSGGGIRMRLTLTDMTGVISPGRADLKGASTKSDVAAVAAGQARGAPRDPPHRGTGTPHPTPRTACAYATA